MPGLNNNARLQWMDAVRGIAIILVVIWHAVSLTDKAGAAVPDWAMQANLIFMPYRMPTLMFLSGLLLASSLRKPAPDYFAGKIRLLVWPYIVWAAVYMLVMGSDYPIYHPRAWFAVGHLWFLFFIAAYYFLAPALRRIPVWAPPVAFLALSIPADGAVNKFLYFGVFFFLGHAASSKPGSLDRILSSRWMPVALLLAAAFGVYAMYADVEFDGLYAPFNIVGIVVCIWLVRMVENHSLIRPIKNIGRNSIVFYVSHVPVIGLLLGAAGRLGIEAPGILIPVTFATALAAAYVLVHFKDSWPVSWMFAMPRVGPLSRKQKTAPTR